MTEVGVPLLGRIPLEAAMADGFDTGKPAVLGEGAGADALSAVVRVLSSEHVPPVEMAGCSARMLDAAVAALDAVDAADEADESDDA